HLFTSFIYALSLHDALPIFRSRLSRANPLEQAASGARASGRNCQCHQREVRGGAANPDGPRLAVTILDWILIAILIASIIGSWFKGFVREVLGLITIVISALLASWFYRSFANLFKDVVRT